MVPDCCGVRDGIMIDDPLSLVLWSSWLMAAGMYPIGFLFGACSDCCPDCPDECSKCTHHTNAQNLEGICDPYFFGTGRTISVSITEQGSDALVDPPRDPGDLFGIALSGVPDIGLTLYGTPLLRIVQIGGSAGYSSCGCEICNAVYPFIVKFGYEPNPDNNYVTFEVIAQIPFDLCSETTKTVNVSGGFVLLEDSLSGDYATLLDWVNSLDIDVTLTLPECDCGACCDSGCEENVAEGGCTAWQGVGVDCDPDPCV